MKRCVVCNERPIEELTDARYNKMCHACWEAWRHASANVYLSEFVARRARRFERARESTYSKMVRTQPAGMAREEAILAVSETFWSVMGKRW